MSKNTGRKCPICQETDWIVNSTPSALIALEKTAFRNFKVRVNNFLPVRALVCNKCGYVALYREEG
jgi:predicted nucleic-acid-binding Zn-ribbon protein